MSKIICDVCGTSYPEAATQCPICGCVRSADAKLVAGDTDATAAESSGTYTYVKGGRFSRTNVRKRSNAGSVSVPTVTDETEEHIEKNTRNDKGLVIAVVLLLLAIIAVVIYIAVRFFGPAPDENKKDTDKQPNQSISDSTGDNDDQNSDQNNDQNDDQTPADVPCVSLVVSDVIVNFSKADETLQLTVTPEPADTTDQITYTSDDETVATVSNSGLVTAIGAGETIIRVRCGQQEVQCSVTCTFEDTTEDPNNDQNEDPEAVLTLNRKDFSLFYVGEQWNLYNGSIPAEDIQWSTSDADVATVSNGVVTAVGNTFTGDYATITAEYNGTKVTCIVRWTPRDTGLPGNGGVSEA